jgi:AraC family transcriptional regulator
MSARKLPDYRTLWRARVGRARRYMRAHAVESLSLMQVAREAGASPYHFSRMFHALTGETPFAYLTRAKLRLSVAMLLEDPRVPITEVALAVGYETPSAFNRCFKAVLGLSPTSLRKLPLGRRSTVLENLDDPHRRRPMSLDLSTTPEMVTRKDQPFLHVRTLGHYSEQAPQAWIQLHSLLGAAGMYPLAQEMIGACWDEVGKVADEALRYDAGLTVKAVPDRLPKGLKQGILPGGKYAQFLYRGSYSRLGMAFEQVHRGWVASTGATLREGPHLEIYLNTPGTVPEEDLRTVLAIPIV